MHMWWAKLLIGHVKVKMNIHIYTCTYCCGTASVHAAVWGNDDTQTPPQHLQQHEALFCFVAYQSYYQHHINNNTIITRIITTTTTIIPNLIADIFNFLNMQPTQLPGTIFSCQTSTHTYIHTNLLTYTCHRKSCLQPSCGRQTTTATTTTAINAFITITRNWGMNHIHHTYVERGGQSLSLAKLEKWKQMLKIRSTLYSYK